MGMGVIQLSSQTHHQNILNALHHLRLQGHLSDIKVQVDYQGHAQTFQAHRVVLAASSDYFRNIFLSPDATPDQISLSNMHPCDFSDFLEFVYTGKAEVAQSRMGDMQAAANILECEELAIVCSINHTSQSDVVEESSPETETGIKKPQNSQLPPESSECLSKRSKGKSTKLKRCIPTTDEAFNAEEDNDTTCASSPALPRFDKDTQSPNDAEEILLVSASEDEDDEESGRVSKRASKGKFVCSDCMRSFHYERSYLKHVSTCHGVKAELVYRCETCMKTFSNRSNLRIHEKHVHSSERLFTCDVCAKTFKRKKDVVRHQKQVHDPHMHQCSECGKRLSSKASLMLHKQTHSGIKAFICTECGSRFTQKSALNMHHRIHTGEKPFMCEACGKSFASKEYLRYHSNIHTGSKPFKCEHCGRGFAQRNSLRQHLTVHTGERPYACNDCDKHFTQLNALQRHQRIHTGEKPYMCGLCNRTFTDKSTLRRHTTTHDANAPWKNYLVVLEGNVEKKSKAQDKGTAQEKKSNAKKASKSKVPSPTTTVLPPDKAGPGAVALETHDHTEMLPEAQVVTSDGSGGVVITLDRPFVMPVEENISETAHSISAETPSMSSLLEEAASQTILAQQEEAAQPDILTVVVSDKMCQEV
ncbi:GDNF-inducible zinc finger protein 1-like isoform X2 [Syngnathus typhle]|uniref:GDNF-inducible zinc finger protein 1-like isoform X2 n=1 Tax=Syngnathus typhle TaxID=161592 RepID=UPI002A6A77F3|nr:GDNF-inducible zinc finger protein 1-like isoform X2 [Syngnathus typhle]